MCGIAGFRLSFRSTIDQPTFVIKHMTETMMSRGPDDAGTWIDSDAGLALGHRRLSILDLSSAGHQPMTSHCDRFVLAFNGEIYNHLKIRESLKRNNISWQGHSDTETLLASIGEWGFEKTLEKTVGMFAIALWDKKERRLYLARDRMGEKPLYYGWVNGSFVFASELKAIRAFKGFNNKINREALGLYFQFNYVPTPYSIYEDIFKLEPGSMLTIDSHGFEKREYNISKWWSLQEEAASSQQTIINDEKVSLVNLKKQLEESIRLQSIADVPLGAFLSGGIDSSLITALMQSHSNIPVKTFSIGFTEKDYDEAIYAKAVAKHLGTEHTELYVKPEESRAVIPLLPSLYDEPFADSSQIPTYLVSKMASDHVTVALSGDAGDELFGGYNRYLWSRKFWSKVSWLPLPLRQTLGSMTGIVSPQQWNWVSKLPFINQRISQLSNKMPKLAQALKQSRNIDDLYAVLVSQWPEGENPVLGDGAVNILSRYNTQWLSVDDYEHKMMYLDSMTYLPDDILCKVDRAAMGNSLETRVPFLDHRVVELAWQLPIEMKIKQGQGKWPLRELLYQYVPKSLIERPKQGFGIPVGYWLRGPLKEWAEALIEPAKLNMQGYLSPEIIAKKWQEHLSGQRNHTSQLWSVLMFQAWLEGKQLG